LFKIGFTKCGSMSKRPTSDQEEIFYVSRRILAIISRLIRVLHVSTRYDRWDIPGRIRDLFANRASYRIVPHSAKRIWWYETKYDVCVWVNIYGIIVQFERTAIILANISLISWKKTIYIVYRLIRDWISYRLLGS